MVDLTLPSYLVHQLEEIAQRENRSVSELLETMLRQYASQAADDEVPPGTLAALARSAQEAGLASSPTDTSERSREILKTEYPDYLRRRMKRDNDADSR